MKRFLVKAAVVITAVVVGGCVDSTKAPAPAPSAGSTTGTPVAGTTPRSTAPARPETLEAQVSRDIVEHGLTAQRAVLEFSLVVGPLPGVQLPTGEHEKWIDADAAMIDIYRMWDQLSPAVRKEASRLLAPPTSVAATSSGTTPSTPSTGTAATRAPAHPASFVAPASFSAAWLVNAPSAQPDFKAILAQPDFEAVVAQANADLAGALNQSPLSKITVEPKRLPGDSYAETATYALHFDAYDQPVGWETYPNCVVQPNLNHLDNVDAPTLRSILTHEVMHCYQQQAEGSGPVWESTKKWLQEGEATWASQMIAPTSLGDGYAAPRWSRYVNTPTTFYADRLDDAVGIYGHLGDVLGDQSLVWPRLMPALAAGKGFEDQQALLSLLAGNRFAFFDSWGSSYFLDPNASIWNMSGPGPVPLPPGPQQDHVEVQDGNTVDIPSVGPSEAELAQLDTLSDVVTITSTSGYGNIRDSTGVTTSISNQGSVTLCLKVGGCVCPDNTGGAGFPFSDAVTPIQLGLSGGDGNTLTTATGQSLDDFCAKPDRQPKEPKAPSNEPRSPAEGQPKSGQAPSGGSGPGSRGAAGAAASGEAAGSKNGSGSGRGSGKGPGSKGGGSGGQGAGAGPSSAGATNTGQSTADPHLTTFDHRHYDLQTVGEYVLTRSTTDDFTVQSRQEPPAGSRQASLNTAVAVRAGGHRVTVDLENKKHVLRVDGAVVSDAATRAGALRVTRSVNGWGSAYRIALDDGTLVQVDPVGVFGLSVSVSLASTRAGKVTGLLGDDDGNPGNDPTLTGGSVLAPVPNAEDLRHLADTWRVPTGQSVFDYADGKHQGSYDDPSFPDPTASVNAGDKAAAEKKCRDDGISDPTLVESCAFDIANTKQPSMAGAYGRQQRTINAATILGDKSLTPHLFTGTLRTKDQQDTSTFDASAGDVGYIGTNETLCDVPGENVAVQITEPGGKVLTTQDACRIGRIAFRTTGSYTIHVATLHDVPYDYAIALLAVRRDAITDATLGSVLKGNIDQRGAHDDFRFTAKANDRITLIGPGCEAAGLMAEIDKPDGKPLTALKPCEPHDPITIPADGAYDVVINSLDAGPATYNIPLTKL